MTDVAVDASVPTNEDLGSLLADWAYLPYRRDWRGDRTALAALEAHRLRKIIEAQGAQTWTARRSGRLSGLAVLRPLPWDSTILGFPASRLLVLASGSYEVARASATALIATAIDAAASHGTKHLSARVNAGNDAVTHALESRGFLNVDTLLTFSAPPDRLSARDHSGAAFRPACAADAAALAELAGDTFRDGRFFADPSIDKGRAREIYRQWAANCCLKTAADQTIAAVADGRLAGFVACRLDQDPAVFLAGPAGTISLIAVHELARGRGVGSALIAHARTWFIDSGASMVEVGTQARNIAAARLYQRCGFRLSDSFQTFHLMIDA